jgi:hypothetical protein
MTSLWGDEEVRGTVDARRLGGHQRLLVEQFQPLAQTEVELRSLAVQALG